MPNPITANHVRQYALCPCSLYLDLHGPMEERAAAHAFLEHLRDLGIEHERVVVDSLPHVAVPDGSLAFRAEITRALLREGHERIYQPVLVAGDLVGIPDFLERVEVPSEFGPFAYRPVDVKISTEAKDEHKDQLAFYGLLLDRTQALLPTDGDVILVDQSREAVGLGDRMDGVKQIVADVREVIAGRAESPTLSSECGMCPWQDHCMKVLYGSHDVSLLDGLGPAKKPVLLAGGFADLDAVAHARPDQLRRLKGIGAKLAARIVPQAKVLLEREPLVIGPAKLPNAEIELYLDMECQNQTQVIYLIGVLQCERGQDDEFLAFVADKPEDEGAMWASLLDYVRALPSDPVIYHYHHFESTHLRKLADRHSIDPESEARLFGGLLDLHPVLKESVVLPVHSYGLKAVAKWMGFKWRDASVDAAMSMVLYDLWLSTGDRAYMEASITYNESDCRATKVVKEWLRTAWGRS